jgi:hypothetical protein
MLDSTIFCGILRMIFGEEMIEFKIKSYREHNFVLVEIYNHKTGTNTTFFHNKSELRNLADFIYETIGEKK